MVYALLIGAARAGRHETHRLVSIGECDLKVAANDEGALSVGRAVSKIGYVCREGRTKCGATRGDVVDQRCDVPNGTGFEMRTALDQGGSVCV